MRRDAAGQQQAVKDDLATQQAQARGEISRSVRESMQAFGGVITENMKYSAEAQALKIEEIGKMQNLRLAENNKKLEDMRETVERKLTELQGDNNRKLDEMRGIVDEKLQQTIQQRMNESFRLVSERLEQVYRGLGEMQTLASGVGDLQKVLANVKTRGILGEVQTGCHSQGNSGAGTIRYGSQSAARQQKCGGIRRKNPYGQRFYLSAGGFKISGGNLRKTAGRL